MNFFQCIPCGLQTCILADYVGLSKKSSIVVLLLLHTNINIILGIGRADGKEKIKKILSADIFIRCPVCVCAHTIHLLDPCENKPVDTQQCFAPRRCSRVYSLEPAPTFSFLVQLHIRMYNIHYTLQYIYRPADYMCGVYLYSGCIG